MSEDLERREYHGPRQSGLDVKTLSNGTVVVSLMPEYPTEDVGRVLALFARLARKRAGGRS